MTERQIKGFEAIERLGDDCEYHIFEDISRVT